MINDELKNLTWKKASIFAVSVGLFTGSANYGTVLPWNWLERHRERQEYSALYDRAVQCSEIDGIEGLNLVELRHLYGELQINVNPFEGTVSLPKLTKPQLEKVVDGCELEER